MLYGRYVDNTSFICADVEFDVEYAVDYRMEEYGEDADGNRGVMQEHTDRLEILKVSIDGKEMDYDKLHKDIANVIDTHMSSGII